MEAILVFLITFCISALYQKKNEINVSDELIDKVCKTDNYNYYPDSILNDLDFDVDDLSESGKDEYYKVQ